MTPVTPSLVFSKVSIVYTSILILQTVLLTSTTLLVIREPLLMTLVCSIAHMYPSRWYVLSARTPSSPKSDLRPATAWLLIHSLRVLPKAAALSQLTETVTTEESLLRTLCDPSDTHFTRPPSGGLFLCLINSQYYPSKRWHITSKNLLH